MYDIRLKVSLKLNRDSNYVVRKPVPGLTNFLQQTSQHSVGDCLSLECRYIPPEKKTPQNSKSSKPLKRNKSSRLTTESPNFRSSVRGDKKVRSRRVQVKFVAKKFQTPWNKSWLFTGEYSLKLISQRYQPVVPDRNAKPLSLLIHETFVQCPGSAQTCHPSYPVRHPKHQPHSPIDTRTHKTLCPPVSYIQRKCHWRASEFRGISEARTALEQSTGCRSHINPGHKTLEVVWSQPFPANTRQLTYLNHTRAHTHTRLSYGCLTARSIHPHMLTCKSRLSKNTH